MIGDCWPEFMNYLDTDPERAMMGLHEYTWRVFERFPPRNLARFKNKEDREDVIRDFIYDCLKEDFRNLRTYVNRGQPMACYLVHNANNFFSDELAKRNRRLKRHIYIDEDPNGSVIDIPSSEPGPDKVLSDKERRQMLDAAIEKLSEKCRILLAFELEGLSWREVAELLGLDEGGNKTLSSDATWCKKKLKKILEKDGIDIRRFI